MSHQPSDVTTPKALLLDKRLTPLDRNAWLAFRAFANDDGTVVLNYDTLRDYLNNSPGSMRAAQETVSRAVLCLRLSTWIAVIEYRRNPRTGFSMASRYAIRNQPLSFFEACLDDGDYLSLLERGLGHASATIRQMARDILSEVMRSPDQLESLPVQMRDRIKQLLHGDDHDPGGPGSTPCDASIHSHVKSDANFDIPKSAQASTSTVRAVKEEVLKEVHTYLPQPENRASGLDVPRRFQQLAQDEQQTLMARLRGLPLAQRQAVLAEWDARCASGYVRDVIAYLYGMIKKAVNGAFKLWAARKPASTQAMGQTAVSGSPVALAAPSSPPRPDDAKPASREVAQRSLEQIRRMLKTSTQSVGQVIDEMLDRGMLPSRPHGQHVTESGGSLGAT